MKPLLCFPQASNCHLCCWSLCFYWYGKTAELLALSDCVELFTKAWSSAVNDLFFFFFLYFIVPVHIDFICHLPRIGYEEAGNQSFERRSCLSLFLFPSLILSLSDSLFMSPGVVWYRLKVEERWKRKRRHLTNVQRGFFFFLWFLALQGGNTKREPSFCLWVPQWSFFLHLMNLFERIFSYFYTTRWFLSLYIK